MQLLAKINLTCMESLTHYCTMTVRIGQSDDLVCLLVPASVFKQLKRELLNRLKLHASWVGLEFGIS